MVFHITKVFSRRWTKHFFFSSDVQKGETL